MTTAWTMDSTKSGASEATTALVRLASSAMNAPRTYAMSTMSGASAAAPKVTGIARASTIRIRLLAVPPSPSGLDWLRTSAG